MNYVSIINCKFKDWKGLRKDLVVSIKTKHKREALTIWHFICQETTDGARLWITWSKAGRGGRRVPSVG